MQRPSTIQRPFIALLPQHPLGSLLALGVLVVGGLGLTSCGHLGVELDEDESPAAGAPGSLIASAGGSSGSGGGAGNVDQPGCDASCVTNPNGLIALYTFEEGAGTTVEDRSNRQPLLPLEILHPRSSSWTSDGLQLTGPALLSSQEPGTKFADAVAKTNEFTVEAWVTPDAYVQEGPARIMTMSENALIRNFMLGVRGSSWVARLRTTEGTSPNGRPDLYSAPVVQTSRQHVVYSRRDNGEATLYLNGRAVTREQRRGELDNWSKDLLVGFGAEFNEELESRNFLGTFELIASYDRALELDEVLSNFRAGSGTLHEPCRDDCSEKFGDALYYQEFEQKSVGQTWVQGDGRIKTASRKSYRGEQSLEVEQKEGGDAAAISVDFSPQRAGAVYLRAWMYVPAEAIDTWLSFAGFHPQSGSGFDLLLDEGQRLGVYEHMSDRDVFSGPSVYPVDQWFCLQVGLMLRDWGGQIYLAIDSESKLFVSEMGATNLGGGISRVDFGIPDSPESQTDARIYFDDVAVDTRPLLCD